MKLSLMPWRVQAQLYRPLSPRLHNAVLALLLISGLPLAIYAPAAGSIPAMALILLSGWVQFPSAARRHPRLRRLAFLLMSLPLIGLVALQLLQVSSTRELLAMQVLLASCPLLVLMRTTRGMRANLCVVAVNSLFAFGLWQGQGWGVMGPMTLMGALVMFQASEEFSAHAPARPWAERWLQLRRLLFLALPPSLLLFFALPHLNLPNWAPRVNTGVADFMELGDSAVYKDPTPVLRVRFQGASPDPDQMYFRSHAFWYFNGANWRGGLSENSVVARSSKHGVTWEYEMERLEEGMEAAALDWPRFPAQRSELTVSWSDDGNIIWVPTVRRHRLAGGAAPRLEELTDLQKQLGVMLPVEIAPGAQEIARRWKGLEPARQLAAIRQWMQAQNLIYTLDPPSPGRGDKTDFFLFEGRQGYCQDFSSAFVVLARAAGLPARIVTGYQGGEYNPYGKFWLIRRADAHAWAEVFIPKRGWVRVDPTSLASEVRDEQSWSDKLRSNALWQKLQAWGQDLKSWLQWDLWSMRQQVLVLMALALLSSAAVGLALWLRQKRQTLPVHERAWRYLLAQLARMGVHRQPSEDPLLLLGRAQEMLDEKSGARLGIAVNGLMQLRYGAAPATFQRQREVAHLLKSVRPRRRKKAPR